MHLGGDGHLGLSSARVLGELALGEAAGAVVSVPWLVTGLGDVK